MSEPNLVNYDRHCAQCLKFLPNGSAKICGKCYRRAYCSKECQVADWKQGKGSQGHKNWCDLKCGEEDIDWEIRPVPGKGLGVIAKRPILSKSRIMVDAIRPHDHPAIQDLLPIGGTLKEKVDFNAFGGDDGTIELCLRLSRINHDCGPNTEHVHDETFGVYVLLANQDIQPGEEITITYVNDVDFSDVTTAVRPITAKKILLIKWGIICEPGCRCYDKNFWKTYLECVDLYRDFQILTSNGNANGAMDAIRKLIENLDAVHAPWSQRMNIFFDAFITGIMKKATVDEAMEYLRRANVIGDEINNPKNPAVQLWKSCMTMPWLHQNYLILEKEKM